MPTPDDVGADSRGRTLKPHQAAGLAAWRANTRRGILAFATGAGKTFTALDAVRESLTKFDEVPVVVVPDKTLFGQWFEGTPGCGRVARRPYSEGGRGLRSLARCPQGLDGT